MAETVQETTTTESTSTTAVTETPVKTETTTTETQTTEAKTEATTTSVADKIYDNKDAVKDSATTDDKVTPEKTAQTTDDKVTDVKDVKDAQAQEYELTVPEKSLLAEADIEQVKSFAKENNLTKEQAQKLLDDNALAFAGFKSRQDAELVEQVNNWKKQSEADSEIGGTKLAPAVEKASRFLDKVGLTEVRTLLDNSGLGNHPTVIKMFARSFDLIADDKMIQAPRHQAAGSGKSLADKLYGAETQ